MKLHFYECNVQVIKIEDIHIVITNYGNFEEQHLWQLRVLTYTCSGCLNYIVIFKLQTTIFY